MGDELEPIVSESSPFRIIFDPHVIRPHFLLVWKDAETNKRHLDVTQINYPDRQRLVTCAKEITQALGLDELAILSFHQGNFANKFRCSTVHLLVTPEKYLSELRKHNVDADVYRNVAEKLDGWFGKHAKINSKYKVEDLDKLYNYIRSIPDRQRGFKFDSDSLLYDLCFHSSQPRIGFRIIDDSQDEGLLIHCMFEFIRTNNISGSHICVCIGGSLSIYDEEFGRQGIVGYLQVHICDFYRLNPNREAWLVEFEQPYTKYEQYT